MTRRLVYLGFDLVIDPDFVRLYWRDRLPEKLIGRFRDVFAAKAHAAMLHSAGFRR